MATVRELQAEFKARASGLKSTIQGIKKDFQGLGQETKGTADKIKKNFENVGSRMKKIGGGMSKAITVPMTALGTLGVANTMKADGALRQLQASTGATGKEAQQLKEDFQVLWKSGIGENPEQVARAMANVRQNIQGINEGKPLQEVTKQALTLAQVTDSDLGEVTRGVNQLMHNFGITSDEAFDLFAKGNQEGINYSNEMFDNISEYAPLFNQMGFSADEYFKILVNGAQNGSYNLDYVNDVMKEFDIRMRDGSKTTADAMGLMSQSTQDLFKRFEAGEVTTQEMFNTVISDLKGMDNQILANQIGVDLFGVKFEDMGAKTMYALNDTNNALGDTEGSMQRISDAQEKSFGTRWQGMIRKVQGLLLPLGNTIIDIAESAMPYVEKLVNWFSKLSPAVQKVVTIIGVLGAALGPVIGFFGMFIGSLAPLAPLFAKLAPLVTKVGLAIGALGTPIGMIVTAVTLLAGVIIANWDQIWAWTKKTFSSISSFISSTWNSVWSWTTNAVTKTVNGIRNGWNTALSWTKNIFSQIGSFLSQTWSSIWTATTNFVGRIVQGIFNAWNRAFSFTKNIFSQIFNFFKSIWNSIYGVFKSFLTPIFEFVEFTFSTIFSAANKIFRALLVLFREIWLAIWRVFQDFLTRIYNFLEKRFTQAYNFTSKIFQSIFNFLQRIWNSIYNFISKILTNIYNFLAKRFTETYNFTTKIFNSVWRFIQNIWNRIYSFFANILSKIYNNIRSRFQDTYNSTRNIFNSVYSFLTNIWNRSYSFISRIVGNIFNRVRNTWNDLKSNTSRIFRDIYNNIRDRFNNIVDRAKELPGKIGEGIGNMAGRVTDGVRKVTNQLTRTLGKGVNGVINGINWVLEKIGSDSTVSNWNVPQWAHGTRNKDHPGGIAWVGDGRGNNAGSELIVTPDGQAGLSPDDPTLVNMPKGTSVVPAKKTKELLASVVPHYALGIGNIVDSVGNAAKATGRAVGNAGKAVWNTTKVGARKVGDWAGNVWDYASNPGKLMDVALDVLGVEVPSGVAMIGDMAKAGFNKVKGEAVGYVKEKFKEMMNLFGGRSGEGWSFPGFTQTSGFGPRSSPGGIGSTYHRGLDFAAPTGTPVPSQSGGIVSFAGSAGGLGNLIKVKAGPYEYWYGHNSALLANVGQSVSPGQPIARTGSTGNSTGPHVHFEVHKNGRAVNPAAFENGGIVDSKQLAWVADGGWAESIISHDPAKKMSQYNIWKDTGDQLGFVSQEKAKKAEQIVQNLTINSPKELKPSEIARKNKQAMRRWAMEWGD